MSRRPILSTAHRARAFVLAVLILAGGLVETIHRAQVGHRVCPEHGELVHGDSACDEVARGDAATAADTACASRQARPTPQVVPSKHSSAHEHCLFVALLSSSAAPWSGGSGGYHVPLGVVVHRAQVPEIPPVAQPPLSFAPKHSPPARAA